MPVALRNPKKTVILDKAKVASFKVESNPSKGTHWIEIWVVFGTDREGFWQEYVDPETGDLAIYFKIEDGKHPLVPERGLKGYDGFSRLTKMKPRGDSIRDAIKVVLYEFLCSEEVPHPQTGELVRLLDAKLEDDL